MEEVRENSWWERDSVKEANSGSSRYWASSERRVVVGWASRVEPCWKDIVAVVEDREREEGRRETLPSDLVGCRRNRVSKVCEVEW